MGVEPDAIQRGVDMASREIVGWFDSDDVFLDDHAITDVVASFAPGVSIVTGAGWHLAEDGERLRGMPVYPDSVARDVMRCVDWVLQPATFVKRELFLKYPLDTDLHFAFDWDFFIRITQDAEPVAIDREITRYDCIGRANRFPVAHHARVSSSRSPADTTAGSCSVCRALVRSRSHFLADALPRRALFGHPAEAGRVRELDAPPDEGPRHPVVLRCPSASTTRSVGFAPIRLASTSSRTPTSGATSVIRPDGSPVGRVGERSCSWSAAGSTERPWSMSALVLDRVRRLRSGRCEPRRRHGAGPER